MSNAVILKDLDYIDFGGDPTLEPFLDVAAKLAVGMDIQDPAQHGAQAVAGAAQRIRALGLDEVMDQLDLDSEVLPLIFQLAETLGYANIEAAWRGLEAIPAQLLGLPASVERIAVPQDAPGRWTLWLPYDDGKAGHSVSWFDPASGTLRGPVTLRQQSPALACRYQEGLLGMPGSGVMTLSTPEQPAGADIPEHHLSATAWGAYCDAQRALVAGLIAGACRRLTREAYTYAKLRNSGGKPICQHQAVAVRLADIALSQQALALYAGAAVCRSHRRDSVTQVDRMNVGYIGNTAFQIARDAVQIAAAHGYVEGLPFKRLFEQTRTLISVLASYPTLGATAGTSQR